MAERNLLAEDLEKKYPSNSISPKKRELPKQESVIKGSAHIVEEKKKGFINKIFKASFKDAAKYAFNDLIIPASKNIVLSTLQMIFFGQGGGMPWFGGSNVPINRTGYSYTSTRAATSQPPWSTNSMITANRIAAQQSRTTHNFSNICFEKYSDAEDVVTTLIDYLDRNGVVPLDVFYSAANLPATAADINWGWTRFEKLETRPVPGGYVIDIFPAPSALR